MTAPSPPPSTARRLVGPTAVAVGAVAVCGFVAWADPTTPGGVVPVCPTKALLGLDCPGCGGARMLYSLLHLDVGAALHYNALGVVALVVAVAAYGGWVWSRARERPVPGRRHLRPAAAVTLALLVAWLLVRNIPVAPFTALRV